MKKPSIPTAISLASILSTIALPAQACSTTDEVKITFFGYPDNDPPGGAIAYDCGRGFTAGGVGSYDDPVTFATATNGPFNRCDVIYIPYLQKYARFEDYCGECGKDWLNTRLVHIDIWTGSATSSGSSAQLTCENTLTRDSKTIIVAPGTDLGVDTSPLFADGTCGTGSVNEDADGEAAGLCA